MDELLRLVLALAVIAGKEENIPAPLYQEVALIADTFDSWYEWQGYPNNSLASIREVWRYPPLDSVHLFPNNEYAERALAEIMALWRQLTDRSRVDVLNAKQLTDDIAYLDSYWYYWHWLRGARAEGNSRVAQRRYLQWLREAIGDGNFYKGHIPHW